MQSRLVSALLVFLPFVFVAEQNADWESNAFLWGRRKKTCPLCIFFFFFFCLFLREVERLCFLDCSALAAVCSFSSEAHLVGYYVKEMESIVEQWVTLFTGKSEDQRQGITHPPDLTFPGNSRCFIWEEGKVQRTLEMVGMTTGTLVQKGGEVTEYLSKIYFTQSPTLGFKSRSSARLYFTRFLLPGKYQLCPKHNGSH